jgi:hypothetical protein
MYHNPQTLRMQSMHCKSTKKSVPMNAFPSIHDLLQTVVQKVLLHGIDIQIDQQILYTPEG